MKLERAAKYAKNVHVLWVLVTGSIFSSIIWAADTRYVTKGGLKVTEIRQMYREVQDLEIQKGYAIDGQQKQMIEARIKVKENQIKALEKEQ